MTDKKILVTQRNGVIIACHDNSLKVGFSLPFWGQKKFIRGEANQKGSRR